MRIARLYLRNYRVFEQPLELELPPGLVGIYGLNGAGKSSLVESIRFALYGRSRTAIDEVRTSGVNADCITEVEFEHEGHLYLVRRTISGAASTVKAVAHADGLQVSEGVRDTGRYVHSVLGMDDTAFRASAWRQPSAAASSWASRAASRSRAASSPVSLATYAAARSCSALTARPSATRRSCSCRSSSTCW